jgi:hypothetical protein
MLAIVSPFVVPTLSDWALILLAAALTIVVFRRL